MLSQEPSPQRIDAARQAAQAVKAAGWSYTFDARNEPGARVALVAPNKDARPLPPDVKRRFQHYVAVIEFAAERSWLLKRHSGASKAFIERALRLFPLSKVRIV